MAEFIVNPRRAPRAPVRCAARLALTRGGYWASPTSDYGPHGCQLVAPAPLDPGSRVFVELANERIDGRIQLAGRVAWVAKSPPWRMGVAFDRGCVPAATHFFERLAALYPGIDSYARAPDRIPEDAPLAPASPPETVPALTDDEVEVLHLVGGGLSARALREKLGGRFEAAANAVFALLGRRYLVVGEPSEAAAAGWARLLTERN